MCVCSYFSSLYFLKCLQLVTSGLKADWQSTWRPLVSQYTFCVSTVSCWKPISARCPLATDHPSGLIVGGRKREREKQEHWVGFASCTNLLSPWLPISHQSARAAITKTPQTHWFRQQKRISHHSKCWPGFQLSQGITLACKRHSCQSSGGLCLCALP